MAEDLPDIEEAALRKISRIDRAIAKMRRHDQGAFVSITNAIEHHLEICPRDPETVRLLAQALAAFLRARGIDPKAAGFESQLRSLLEYSCI
jgi:hypothetical protein